MVLQFYWIIILFKKDKNYSLSTRTAWQNIDPVEVSTECSHGQLTQTYIYKRVLWGKNLINKLKKVSKLLFSTGRKTLLSKHLPTKCFLGGPLMFVRFACAPPSAVSVHTHVKFESFNWVPFDFENLLISMLSVHLSKQRVGQDLSLGSCVTTWCGNDNVEATAWKRHDKSIELQSKSLLRV